jgi:hypothetical protein
MANNRYSAYDLDEVTEDKTTTRRHSKLLEESMDMDLDKLDASNSHIQENSESYRKIRGAIALGAIAKVLIDSRKENMNNE